MLMSRLVALVLFSLAMLPSVNAQELLTWKFQKGEQLKYGVVQNMQTSQKIGDQDIKSSISQQMDMGWEVLDVAAGGATVMNQTVNRIRLKMDGGPAGVIEFDTAQEVPPGNPQLARMSAVFGNIVNQAFVVTMTPSGQVQNVLVPAPLLEAIRKTPAGSTGALSESTLKDMMKQSAVTLPDQPVKSGSKWSSSQTVKLAFGTMNVKSTMTYVEKDSAGNVIIDVLPEITVTPAENVANKMTLKSSEGRGRVVFNNQAGRVTQSQLNLTLLMKMEVKGESFDQVVQQTTAMKLAN